MASPLLSYAEAAECVQRYLLTLGGSGKAPIEMVMLEAALGRVLAEPICADRDQPPFPRATRDGFAGRAMEANSHEYLFLAGGVKAGDTPACAGVGPGEVWEIMTGAPVPVGADAVFMVEHAELNSSFVRLAGSRSIQAGENIVPRGAEARAGDLLVPDGVRLGAAQIAMAAQCGYAKLAVAARPRVAILSTGDELVAVDAVPGPSQIRNSNSPMLAALVAQAGGEPMVMAAVADREALLDAAIAQALECDLLLITGGISAGRFDLVEGALDRTGARFLFRGVAMQPGKPVVFGELARKSPAGGRAALPFFALPGNPISSAVTFALFAAPVLAALGGDSGPSPRFALAQLAGEWSGKRGLTRFLPASCDFASESGTGPRVRLIPWQGSGDIAAFARSNCFVAIPPETELIAESALVEILLS